MCFKLLSPRAIIAQKTAKIGLVPIKHNFSPLDTWRNFKTSYLGKKWRANENEKCSELLSSGTITTEEIAKIGGCTHILQFLRNLGLKSSHWSCSKACFKGYTFCFTTFLDRPSTGAQQSHELAPKTFK